MSLHLLCFFKDDRIETKFQWKLYFHSLRKRLISRVNPSSLAQITWPVAKERIYHYA